MDKIVLLAVAGSGKTSWIVNNLDVSKRNLILTYTNANLANIHQKLRTKFGDDLAKFNIDVQSYFIFLYCFCFLPFFADRDKPKGITFSREFPQKIPKKDRKRYYDNNSNIYAGRIADYLITKAVISELIQRIEKYFDVIYIDEIQDIAGHDFSLLEAISSANISYFFLGDFYQHTFDSSRDGNTNSNLFDDYDLYKSRFVKKGFKIDETTLLKSYRCKPKICSFVTKSLGIKMEPVFDDDIEIGVITDADQIRQILDNDDLVKLVIRDAAKKPFFCRNWGDIKGEDHFEDVAIILTQDAMKLYPGRLNELPKSTLRKLYVACTRARRNLYLINPKSLPTNS